MSVMLCTGANFTKKNPCLVAGIVPCYTSGLHLLTFNILEPYPSKDITLGLFFFYQVFLSLTLTTHRTAGEGRGPFFNSNSHRLSPLYYKGTD